MIPRNPLEFIGIHRNPQGILSNPESRMTPSARQVCGPLTPRMRTATAPALLQLTAADKCMAQEARTVQERSKTGRAGGYEARMVPQSGASAQHRGWQYEMLQVASRCMPIADWPRHKASAFLRTSTLYCSGFLAFSQVPHFCF